MTAAGTKDHFQSGFVSILGRPNVGKSTLLNALIGEKIAIVSPKPQTTRNQVMGIYLSKTCQIVFLDTPGIHTPKSRLGETMVKSAYGAAGDVDCIVYLVQPAGEVQPADAAVIERLRGMKGTPVILAINKVDRAEKELVLQTIAAFSKEMEFAAIVPISALTGQNLPSLLDEILARLPEGPKYFPDDMITDQPEKQVVAELIREKALRFLQQEIPHGIFVEIEQMKEEEKLVRISAALYCEKNSHKAIIIGKGGAMLKKIGSAARADIERFLDAKVHLELWVRVKEDWRNNMNFIRSFGMDPAE